MNPEEGEIDHFSYINFVLKEDDKIELMEHLLDQNKINLFSYIYMRRLNYAWKVCSTSGSLAANQIQCAVSHTNPRSLSLSSYEEKTFFQLAVRLNRGFYDGQESRLDVFEFVSVSFIFEYLSQFEVHFSDRVTP